MLYLRTCLDDPARAELRDRLLREHRRYVASCLSRRGPARVIQAGPMCGAEAGAPNIGSFMIVEADSSEAVEDFHANDPFTKAGLFKTSQVIRWDRHVDERSTSEYVP